jgi:integrase
VRTLPTRLHKRPENGIYYCRVAVPIDLVSVIGKREVKVSLKTSNLRIATRALLTASYAIESQFMAARGEEFEPVNSAGFKASQGITIKQLVEFYFAAREQARLTPSTVMDYKIRFRVIMDLMGEDKPIKEISRQDCRLFQQQVLALPPNAFKRFPKMSLLKVIEHAKRNKLGLMAPKTVNLHISCLNLLMEWACRERLLDANPARGLWVAEKKRLQDKRDPFTTPQLHAIFNNEMMKGYQKTNSARFWVPMLSLWTGARLNEICQLMVGDVGVEEGIYYLKVTEGDGKQVKTASANRIIPLHPDLIKMGFDKFFEARKKYINDRLFAELRNGSRGKPSEPFSKWFARHLQITKTKTEANCFHSFRHNFRDALREAGIEREVVQALGGWKDKSAGVEDNYGSGHSIKRLHDAICKISYVGIV